MKKISYTVCVNEPDLNRAVQEKEESLWKEKRSFKTDKNRRKICTDNADYLFATAEILSTFCDQMLAGLHINSLQFTDERHVRLSVVAWKLLMERRALGGELTEEL